MSQALTPAQFVAKWRRVELSERAASQEHFIDLCRVLGQPTPAEHDATGAEYTFERGVAVSEAASRGSSGDRGFADVWWKGKFGWEYKRRGKYASLDEAYRQLQVYREALENPPLLIVSDIARIEIHTNFTGTRKEVHTIALEEMAETRALDLLRRVFTDPESFRPAVTTERVTQEVAKQLGDIAQRLRERGHDPHAAAHFLMKCMFCLFAEDVGLLPNELFKKILSGFARKPGELKKRLDGLFDAMRTGGAFGIETVPWFNGGLFDEEPALELTEGEANALVLAANQDWGAVEPAIFGTLFERSLDPDKRSQIGAHYTSREDILLVVEPVIMEPLRAEWEEVKGEIRRQVERRRGSTTAATKRKANEAISAALQGFVARLAGVRILDPACGSGNFLYVAIQRLLELEKEVITFGAEIGEGLFPRVRPTQLHGIEINPYAAELAQVVIWIGYLQWMRDNGFNAPRDPILEPLQTIENRDAILAWVDENGRPTPAWREGAACTGPAEWPEADFIIGNPPFLGSKMFRKSGLPDAYVRAMYDNFDLPNTSDLCCYWFELARQAIVYANEHGGKGFGAGKFGRGRFGQGPISSVRVGLLATQGIRGGDNRTVLERIANDATIFMAWSDLEWLLDGAAVHVSIVGLANGRTGLATLDGKPVARINADLTLGAKLSDALPLRTNQGVCFQGQVVVGPFDIEADAARMMLASPNGSPEANGSVVLPVLNARDITARERGVYIIDFDQRSMAEASSYEAPFEYVRRHVKPLRDSNKDRQRRERWWQHGRAGTELRAAVADKSTLIVTPRVAKFRLFRRLPSFFRVTDATVVFARSDDYFFGVLHSSVHELWARRMGTQLREAESGFRYTPTTCFETFPLPWAPGREPGDKDPLHRAISEAARALDEQRERWLNPPEWIAEIERAVDARDRFDDVAAVSGDEARRLIRRSAVQAAAAKDPRLKKRTLTNLYNERPTWLRLAHERLDRAVLAAYASVDPEGGWDPEWATVWTETGAGQPMPDGHELGALRAETDERVLANLLRLNQQWAGAKSD